MDWLHTDLWWDLVSLFATAAVLCFCLMAALQMVAPNLNLLDRPGGRKDHARPIPVTGGIAMSVAALVVGLSLFESTSAFKSFALAAFLLVLVGVLDDLYDLRWWFRIGVQALAALVVVQGGVRIEQIGPVFGMGSLDLGYLSVPFTVFATVGLINAVNMIDGRDGLAGTLVLSCLAMLAGAAVYSGNVLIAERSAVLCGVLLAFLWFNWRFPWRDGARAFMGNSGSAFLGLVVAWFSFRLTQNPGHPVSPVLALWLLPVPVIDCLVLILRRLKEGRSPFAADRNHIHHLMSDAGYGAALIGFSLAGFSFACGLAAAVCMLLKVPHPWLLIAYFALAAFWCWLTMRRERAVALFRWLRGVRVPELEPQPQPEPEEALAATPSGRE